MAGSPWIYQPSIVRDKLAILALVEGVWDRVQPKIRSDNYSIDFAVAPDLSACWIVEINNFLPPLAGSGLFKYRHAADRTVIERGPFEFRIKETPVTPEDFVSVDIDEATGRTTTTTMHPAPPHIMKLVGDVRKSLAGDVSGAATSVSPCTVS